MDETVDTDEDRYFDKTDKVPEVIRLLMTLLPWNQASFTKIIVPFEGYADSGNIEKAWLYDGTNAVASLEEFLREKGLDTKTCGVEIQTSSWSEVTKTWKGHKEIEQMAIPEALVQYVDRLLDVSGVDWYNSDGGGGEYVLTFTEEGFVEDFNMYVNVSTTEQAVEVQKAYRTLPEQLPV